MSARKPSHMRKVVLALAVLGCSSDGPETREPEDGQRCLNSCESQPWPRVIIAARDANGAELTGASITAVDTEGSHLMSYLHGCPPGLPVRYLCTYGLHGAAGNPELTISFRAESGEVSEAIALRPQSYCGREIAYLTLFSSLEHGLIIENVEFISPCLDFDTP
jgi:hypothetical protein